MGRILPVSVALLAAVSVQILCQIFKLIYYSIAARRLDFSYLITAGGMPSAHSAFVSALTVSLGLWGGVHSEAFAVSCVFSLIVIYDAYRLRGTVEHHARVLKKLLADHPALGKEELSEMVGHTPKEILVGIFLGGGFAAFLWALLRSAVS
jgi:uncharacterized protein